MEKGGIEADRTEWAGMEANGDGQVISGCASSGFHTTQLFGVYSSLQILDRVCEKNPAQTSKIVRFLRKNCLFLQG